jgi:hypothetical protein
LAVDPPEFYFSLVWTFLLSEAPGPKYFHSLIETESELNSEEVRYLQGRSAKDWLSCIQSQPKTFEPWAVVHLLQIMLEVQMAVMTKKEEENPEHPSPLVRAKQDLDSRLSNEGFLSRDSRSQIGSDI